MRNKKYVLFVIMLVCGFIACEGPTGPTGPAGPQGLQGEQGPQGEEGNANVVADTLTLTDSDWQYGDSTYILYTSPVSYIAIFTRYVNLDISAITQEILNAGGVFVYMQKKRGAWVSLPLTFTSKEDDFLYNYTYEIFEGQIRLHYYHSANDPNATVPSHRVAEIPTRLYKWVVAEGNIAAKMKAEGIDMTNYNEVMDYFNSRSIPVNSGTVMQN